MKRRGLTLIELLVVTAMMGFIVTGALSVLSQTSAGQQRLEQAVDQQSVNRSFEDRLTELLKGATLSTSATNQDSFFIGQQGNLTDATVSGGMGGLSTGSLSSGSLGGLPGGTADTLVFTTSGQSVSNATLKLDDDWETQNETFGPQGGIAEVQIGAAAVGEANGQTGLFLREQRPADADPSQGGTEKVLNSEIKSIQFEFWNGLEWQATWDTRSMSGARRLPAAIRVTYVLNSDANDQNHVLVVGLPNSDVTSTNPVTQSTGTVGG